MKNLIYKILYFFLLKKTERKKNLLKSELEKILQQKQYVKTKDFYIKGFVSVRINSSENIVIGVEIGHDFNNKKQIITEHILAHFYISEEYFQRI